MTPAPIVHLPRWHVVVSGSPGPAGRGPRGTIPAHPLFPLWGPPQPRPDLASSPGSPGPAPCSLQLVEEEKEEDWRTVIFIIIC